MLASLRCVMLPVIDGCIGTASLNVARGLSAEVTLVGVVALPVGEPLSSGAAKAQHLRRRLRTLLASERFHSHGRVLVSHTPWAELREVMETEDPDLALPEWPEHLVALRMTAADALRYPPCDLALVRGPLPDRPQRVLVPIRGGPQAELSLRIGLNLQPRELTALHIQPNTGSASDSPYRGLERVLDHLPEVHTQTVRTEDAAGAILESATQFDLTIIGAAARPAKDPASIGPVADRLLTDLKSAVMVVKAQRSMPDSPLDETVGAGAISILVDKWFAENTFDAQEFADIQHLVTLKREQGLTISLALPALDEEATVGKVIRTLRRALMEKAPLIDEMILADSDSSDRTRAIASRLAACRRDKDGLNWRGVG